MKHWFFAFVVVAGLSWYVGPKGWVQEPFDPVQHRAETIEALRHAEELLALYEQHRELLIRMDVLSDLSFRGTDPDQAQSRAEEWVNSRIEHHQNQVRFLKYDLNQAQ